jgi:hypothetical protein
MWDQEAAEVPGNAVIITSGSSSANEVKINFY